jgi:hypothetical protein
MALLSTAFNRTLTDEMVSVYHGVVGPQLDTDQWERAVRRSLEAENFFPPPAVLLRYGLADGSPQARAVEAYERILGEFECGRPMGPREVKDVLGRSAMEAFVAAGGVRAFEWCEPDDEPFRRKYFVEAWQDVTEQEPQAALPSGEGAKLLA